MPLSDGNGFFAEGIDRLHCESVVSEERSLTACSNIEILFSLRTESESCCSLCSPGQRSAMGCYDSPGAESFLNSSVKNEETRENLTPCSSNCLRQTTPAASTNETSSSSRHS